MSQIREKMELMMTDRMNCAVMVDHARERLTVLRFSDISGGRLVFMPVCVVTGDDYRKWQDTGELPEEAFSDSVPTGNSHGFFDFNSVFRCSTVEQKAAALGLECADYTAGFAADCGLCGAAKIGGRLWLDREYPGFVACDQCTVTRFEALIITRHVMPPPTQPY